MPNTLQQTNRRRIFTFTVLVTASIAALHLLPFTPIVSYVLVFIASSVIYLLLCRDTLHEDAPTEGLFPLLLILFALRLSFLATQPVGSDDVYRYQWDGRVQSAGINPYRYAPNDSSLASLHSPNLPSKVNHPDLKTVYFPLSEWIFYTAYRMSGEQMWGIRFFIEIAELLTVVGLFLLLKELALPAWRVLIYAANPLAILQFSIDTHVDALGFPFIVFALYCYLRKRTIVALLLLGCSLLIKPTMLILLPILFLDQQGVRNKLQTLLLPLGIVFAAFLPYAIGTNPFEALSSFTQRWYFNGALFNLLLPLLSDNETTRIVCLAVFVVLFLLLLARRKGLIESAVLGLMLLILCSPVAHVWYIGWLVALLPVVPISSGLMLAATASLPSITFMVYQLHGSWKDNPIVLIVEYVPVLFLLSYDLRKQSASFFG